MWQYRSTSEMEMLRQQSRRSTVPGSGLWSGGAALQGDQFSAKVTSQVPLQYDSNFGISIEITLQRFNLPTQRAHWLYCHCIHSTRSAGQQQCRAYEVTRN